MRIYFHCNKKACVRVHNIRGAASCVNDKKIIRVVIMIFNLATIVGIDPHIRSSQRRRFCVYGCEKITAQSLCQVCVYSIKLQQFWLLLSVKK